MSSSIILLLLGMIRTAPGIDRSYIEQDFSFFASGLFNPSPSSAQFLRTPTLHSLLLVTARPLLPSPVMPACLAACLRCAACLCSLLCLSHPMMGSAAARQRQHGGAVRCGAALGNGTKGSEATHTGEAAPHGGYSSHCCAT